jgi:CO/xanthine dehydrogenase Mo-binding subunit
MGVRRASPNRGSSAGPNEMYAIPNRRTTMHVVSLPTVWETPLRTGNLRDPNGPQSTFASESFIDELAAAANADPVEFRLKLLAASSEDNGFKKARSIAVVKAAAESSSGIRVRRRSASPAVNSHRPRHRLHLPQPDRRRRDRRVEVNRQTGRVWIKRLVCAHDCGLVINPRRCAARSKAACCTGEAAHCTRKWVRHREVTSGLDVMPTLTHLDTPESIEIILVNGDPTKRADLPHYGAGETMLKPTMAAIANAIFDATGVRLRRVPFRDARVLAALKTARV